MADSIPIGVFDSGYGGLSVLREMRQRLPKTDFVYLGDSGRAPYGGRDLSTVLDFSEQCAERLFAEGCELVIVACHTVSCIGLRYLQEKFSGPQRRILGVTIPTSERAVQLAQRHVGILGTHRTVESHTFRTEIAKLDANLKVTEVAASVLAPIVEEGWEETEVAESAIRRYIKQLSGVDVIVLGCTHYPLLKATFKKILDPSVQLLDPASYVAERLEDWLQRHPSFNHTGSGELRVLCSGDTQRFSHNAQRFLGETIPHVEYVVESSGRLVFEIEDAGPQGQYMRKI